MNRVRAVFIGTILAAAASAYAAPRANILLIVLDTVRYDAVSASNTPFLDSLSRRGIVFSAAYSTHDFTPTSHFSFMTGLRDGLGTDDDRAENGVASQLSMTGYATFATIANSLIGTAQMPVMRGFASFQQLDDIHQGGAGDMLTALGDIDQRLALFRVRRSQHNRAMLYYSADRILPQFLDQIRTAHAPYFGFVNLVDAHEPYVPRSADYKPETHLPEHFEGDVMGRRLSAELADPMSISDPARRELVLGKIAEVGYARLLSLDLSAEALAIYKRRYMATVHDLDDVLRQFFETAQSQHLLDNTIVIITSDHGEEFGEAGHITHMLRDHGDFEATRHVPLIVVLPPSMKRTAPLVDRRVSLASLAPTLFDLAGVDWSPFASVFADYPRSLAPLFTTLPARIAKAAPPTRAPQDQTREIDERAKAMLSLGYIH